MRFVRLPHALCARWRSFFEPCRSSALLEAVIGVRIDATPDFAGESADGDSHVLSHLRISLQKSGRECVIEPEKIGKHQHLPIAIRSCADADRRNTYRGGDPSGNGRGNELEDERERAGLFESLRFHDEALRIRRLPSLNAGTSDRIYRLRSEADVSHHRNTRPNE